MGGDLFQNLFLIIVNINKKKYEYRNRIKRINKTSNILEQ